MDYRRNPHSLILYSGRNSFLQILEPFGRFPKSSHYWFHGWNPNKSNLLDYCLGLKQRKLVDISVQDNTRGIDHRNFLYHLPNYNHENHCRIRLAPLHGPLAKGNQGKKRQEAYVCIYPLIFGSHFYKNVFRCSK